MIDNPMEKKILQYFEEISKIPRGSKNEQQIADWLENWGKENGFEVKKDSVNNIVIKVPATPGYENSPVVVIQGHLDMVCEKTPDSDHDFTKDPIKLIYENGWLTADKTTLGADNGIAVAMALTLASEKDIEHPPLELLFTVDEETGLTGARALELGFIEGKILLNLDSEDEGYFTVGCAGGKDSKIELPLEFCDIGDEYVPYGLVVGGLKGGHSGIDINDQRGNAIWILSTVVEKLLNTGKSHIVDIQGGSAHNAIPRDAHAVLFVKKEKVEEMKKVVADAAKQFQSEYSNTDPELTIKFGEYTKDVERRGVILQDCHKICQLLIALPHGVSFMSTDIKNLVETSNNLATLKLEDNTVKILTSQRSSVMSRLDFLTNRIEDIARLSGAKVESGDGYPSWEPNMQSDLLAKCKDLYKKLENKEPVIEAIHAGLECGIIGSKYSGMDMISFGPTIKNPHSPEEKIEIKTIGKVWNFLLELLKIFK